MENLLTGFNESERVAYLGSIASIAMADAEASEDELTYLQALVQTSGVSESSKKQVLAAATNNNPAQLKAWLNELKDSELRFSLVADLIAFAESDNNYTQQEKTLIENIAGQLNINQQQYGLLNEFVQQAGNLPAASLNNPSEAMGFFDNLGLGKKMDSAGINMGSLSKGLLSIVGPLLIAKLLKGKSGASSGGGLLGGLLGGGSSSGAASGGLGDLLSGGLGELLGGNKGGGGGGVLSDLLGGGGSSKGGGTLSDLLGGGNSGQGGGIGSLISGLGGNKGFGNSGKLLESLFK